MCSPAEPGIAKAADYEAGSLFGYEAEHGKHEQGTVMNHRRQCAIASLVSPCKTGPLNLPIRKRMTATTFWPPQLFDLIIMVFKYQLCACRCSSDLIQITLNHLNSLAEVTDKQPIKLLIALAR